MSETRPLAATSSSAQAARESAYQRPLSFRNVDRAFAWVAGCVLLLTFGKGFRFPGLWAATHFTFNYSQGFVKRALIGELARRIGGDDVYQYNVFVAFSFLILFAVGAALFIGVRRALRAHDVDWNFRSALLVACASPGTIFLVHIVGYFDFIGLLALLGLLYWALRSRRRFSAWYAITAVGLILPFIHEGLVIMFGPTALFIALCQWLRAHGEDKPTRGAWLWFAVHALLATLLVAATVIAISAVGAPRTVALQRFAKEHADFALRSDAFDVLTQSTYRNLMVVVPSYWSWPGSRTKALIGQSAFLPGFFFLIAFGLRELVAARGTRWLKLVLCLCFAGAALAPQFMNFVGWDWQRWNSMSLMTLLICIVAYKLYFPAAPRTQPSLRLVTVGVLLTAVGLASTMPLYDGFSVQFFPYERQLEFVQQVLVSGFHYRPAN
jgi:hypothetical protein